jgi:tetratricopeptide (TPR) repeat protein
MGPDQDVALKISTIHRHPTNFFLVAFVGVLIAAGATVVGAQLDSFSITVETNPQVFATMCALDAGGFDAEEDTLSEMPTHLALRSDLLRMQGPATDALRQFYRDHALADPADTLSRYITFALVVGPPPTFEFETDRELLPPDVLSIDGFQGVLAAFYKEARLDIRWAKVQPEYEPLVEAYRPPARKVVTVVDAYLREVERPSSGRSFAVYVEPLVGARTNFRNFGDHYAIVVGTNPDAHVDAIQHAFLHFKLDPLVLKYRPLVDIRRDLLYVAGRAPRLPEEYRSDFVSFTDECLIKAVELRLRHLAPDRLEAAMKDADASGFILVRPFVAQLQKFEKDEPAMSYYFPDLISGISVDAEKQRLKDFAFAPGDSAPAPDEHGGAAAAGHPSELNRWLAEGDREIASKDAAAATATFQTVLGKYPDEPRGLYGLAIASVLAGKADEARSLFERLISLQNSAAHTAGSEGTIDPGIIAWAHVYLGRIHDLEDQRDLAVNEYRAALSIDGAPEAARAAAQSGVETAYKPPQHAGEDRQP